MENIGSIAGSVLLGAAGGAMGVQVMVFIASLFISLAGFVRERQFVKKYFILFVKSVLGILACVIVTLLGDYIFRVKLGYTYATLDQFIFWAVCALTVLAFAFHVFRKVKRSIDIVSTPEFDAFHTIASNDQSVDDYVKKNLELLKVLQDPEDEN